MVEAPDHALAYAEPLHGDLPQLVLQLITLAAGTQDNSSLGDLTLTGVS